MTSSCNLGAVVLIVVFGRDLAQAQTPAGPSPPSSEHRASDTVNFLAGALVGLAIHEAGHLMFDVAFDTKPRVKGVRFGPVPFFAIAHRDVSPRREVVISSAGCWMQDATREWLLARHPPLRQLHAPFKKGVLAFNVLNSVGYGIVAFARPARVSAIRVGSPTQAAWTNAQSAIAKGRNCVLRIWNLEFVLEFLIPNSEFLISPGS